MRWPAHEDFWIGVNLPWLNYGGDFGANAWREDGGVGRPSERLILRDALARIAGEGLTRIRWFMLCDGRAGLRVSPDGALDGLDDFVFRDADAAIDELGRAGLSAIFVLFDFHWFRPAAFTNGVQTCGRARLAADPLQRARLLERVVAPLLERYGRHPSILAWDVINEPEWVTRGARLPRRPSEVPRAVMRDFIRDIVGLINQRTSHAATVGSASVRTLPLVEGLGLDVYQAHWYDRLDRKAPLDRPVTSLGLDRPLILGEFPTRGSRRMPIEIVEVARQNDYAGALAWSVLSDDEATDHPAFVADLGRLRRV
ncbi:MAG: hypothetical protein R6V57_17515 [Vicinamibacterales bacterium]